MKSILNIMKNEFPDKSIDISECLQLLNEVINSTMDDIMGTINKSFNNRDFNKVSQMTKLAEEATKYENIIEDIIEMLDIEEKEILIENLFESDKKPDYESCRIDHNIEHSLYENFTHIRPFGFKFLNKDIITTSTWREMLIEICEILINMDKEKFRGFTENPKMNGRKRKHFSKDMGDIREPYSISNIVFIELNVSSNGIRNIIIKMLKEFKINPKEVKIYYSHDYNELNKG